MERRNLNPVDAVMYGLISKALEKTVWREGMKPSVASARQRLREKRPEFEWIVGFHACICRRTTEADRYKMVETCFDVVWFDVWDELKTWEGCTGATSFHPFGEVTLFEL
jgi:hypothetical protein